MDKFFQTVLAMVTTYLILSYISPGAYIFQCPSKGGGAHIRRKAYNRRISVWFFSIFLIRKKEIGPLLKGHYNFATELKQLIGAHPLEKSAMIS